MLPLLAFGLFGIVSLVLLLYAVAAPLFFLKLPHIDRAIAMESRLAALEARVDRLAAELATLGTGHVAPRPAGAAPPLVRAAPVVVPLPVTKRTAVADAPTDPPVLAPPTGTISAPDIEERLGANWLNKAGASILVLGIAFFLAYQLGHMGAAGKDLIGYVTATTLLFGGVFLERRTEYQLFSRGATAGGWALMFFTTYAINHVPAARILTSSTVDLVLMLGVAAGMVAHTLRYRSQAVTSLAFLLAFLTVTISHDTVFSLSAGAVLACAAVFIANRMRWHALEVGAIAATYLNHFVWLQPIVASAHHQPIAQFWTSASILVVYWAVFRAAFVVRAPENAAGERWSTLAAVLNTGLLLMVGRYQTANPQFAFWALILFGVVEAAIAQLPRVRNRRLVFVTLTTLGMTSLVAALPFRVGGARLSVLWLAEAEALICVAAWTRDTLFHRLGTLTAALVGVYLLAFDPHGVNVIVAGESGARELGLTLLTAACAFYIDAYVVPRRWAALYVHPLDRAAAAGLSWAASLFVALGAWYELGPLAVASAWALSGLVLLEFGVRAKARNPRLEGYVVLVLSFLRIFSVNLNAAGAPGWLSPRVYSVAPLILLYLWIYQRLDARERSEKAEVGGVAPQMLCCFATIAAAALVWTELPAEQVIVGWAALVVALLIAALILERRVFVGQALAGTLLVGARGVLHNLYGHGHFEGHSLMSPEFTVGASVGLFLASLPIAFQLRERSRLAPSQGLLAILDWPEQTLFFVALGLMTWLLAVRVPSGFLTIGWGIEAVAVFLFALWVRERTFRISALGLLLVCIARIVAIDAWSLDPRDRYLTFIGLGVALMAVSFLYSRYRTLLRAYL